MARPDEKQSPGGFETSAELRRTPQSQPSARAPVAAGQDEAAPAYERPGRRRGVLIAAAALIVLLAVAVTLYLAV